jgi:glycosyltransferase involved in cell wall biosynthesis
MVDPPGSDNPLVSVVLTTYNRKSMLGRALRSVFVQTRAPDEIIVCDDGSTDGTEQALSIEFPSVVWLKQENKGVASARNLGIRHARGHGSPCLTRMTNGNPKNLNSSSNA